jgi:hypothetical protein
MRLVTRYTPSCPRPSPSFPRKRESSCLGPASSAVRRLSLTAVLLLSACTAPLKPSQFSGSGNGAFNPIAFFTGHETSWGVEENRGGQPTGIVTTDCLGTPDGAGGITMVQTLHIGGKTTTRIWRMRQTGAKTYTATANDMDGTATATVGGRALHWRWILETSPGNPLANVTMNQWFYQMTDGAVMIRTTVTKAGFLLLQISEQFEKA